jgi:cytochrome c553
MPAWPAQQRDDEVWATVAFLRRMPDLDPIAYRRLATGNAAPESGADEIRPGSSSPPVVRSVCSRCHGLDGAGRGPGAFPSLAGQRAEYIYASLHAFADRTRFSGIMSGVAGPLGDDAMRSAAAYYAGLTPRRGEPPADPSALTRGGALASRGAPERDIPPCVECHGPTAHQKNPVYPRLTGQYARYLAEQLRLLQGRRRGGSPNVTLMHVFVDRLRQDEIQDVASFYGAAAAPSRVSEPLAP